MGGAMKDSNLAVKESLTAQDHIRDATKMVALTSEQAQQIEEVLVGAIADSNAMGWITISMEQSLTIIRAARAQEQAEQEPVAWMHKCGGVCSAYDKEHMFGFDYFNIPLYAAPQPVKQEPVAVVKRQVGNSLVVHITGNVSAGDLLYAAPQPMKQEPDDWCDKIIGMEVSIDVSTGEDDIHHRIFGRVDGVMLQSCGAQEDTILVIEDSRNFASPLAFQFPRDTESWTGGWTIDYKVIRSVDAEIEDNEFKPCLESVEQVLLALEKVYAAPQPVQQVPVGKVLLHEGDVNAKGYLYNPLPEGTDLYAAPVQQVDLTDDEICEIVDKLSRPHFIDFARAVIAADRERNRG